MELAVPSFVFTPGRHFRERTASGPLDSWIQANPGAAHQLLGYPRKRSRRVLAMQTTKQLQRFYGVEVFRPQPPIPGPQRAESGFSPRRDERLRRRELSKTQ